MNCVNCHFQCDTPHCPQCGQKMKIKRVAFKGVISDFLSKWIGFDNQFGRTVKNLLLKPEEVVNGYLKGNRVKHVGPFGYLVIVNALLLFSFDIFDLSVEDFLAKNQKTFVFSKGGESTPQQEQWSNEVLIFFAKYFRFVSAVIIPFWAITVGFFYRKEKFNYTERLVITSYITAEGLWLIIIQLAVFAFSGHLFSFLIFILSFGYSTYALTKVFPRKNYFLNLFKSFWSGILAYLLLFILAFIIGVIAKTNSEMFP